MSDLKFTLLVLGSFLLLGPPLIVFVIWYMFFCLQLIMGPM